MDLAPITTSRLHYAPITRNRYANRGDRVRPPVAAGQREGLAAADELVSGVLLHYTEIDVEENWDGISEFLDDCRLEIRRLFNFSKFVFEFLYVLIS